MPCPQPDDSAPSSVPDPTQATTCVRCKANPALAIFRDAIYCQACALTVFDQKAKSGLEFARGAGLAKYVAAAKAESSRASASISYVAAVLTSEQGKKNGKQINNGSGNAEVHVSANVAIAFSGGASSRALLRTATQYFRPETSFDTRSARRAKARGESVDSPAETAVSSSKRGASNAAGRFNEIGKIFVLHIDDSAIIPNGVDRTEEARKMVENENCPDLHFVALKLQDIYRIPSSDAFEGVAWTLRDGDAQHLASATTSVSDPTQALKDLFASLHPSNTPRTAASSARTRLEDMHRLLVSTLLRRTATELDCAALLLGDSATRISIRLIEDLAKGAGHKLPVQGSDAAWIDDLLVVRPLKGHLLQEVLFYTSTLGLEEITPEQHVVPPTVSTRDVLENTNAAVPAMDKSSIARLTETFILNLEKGVPSTVTTIGKTGGKLVLNAPADDALASSASHPISGNASNSTSGFANVGPSVSLRTRGPGALTDPVTDLTLSGPPAGSEPRIGSRGIKLAQASAACFRWHIRRGCALCGMPSQQPHARYWKRDITISSLAETAPSQSSPAGPAATATQGQDGFIELSDHLCYACLLVLAPPPSDESTASLLPAYVLEHVNRSTGTLGESDDGVASGLSVDQRSDEDAQNGNRAHCASHEPAPQPLKRSEIKAQINEFLLDDA